MSTKTNNLNMTLPTGTENITRSVINGNFEIVDAAVKSDRDRLDAIEDWKPSESGTSGQLLRTNGDGTTQWVDQGLPTDEQTADAVNAWLDNHPEATTTVEDGAITRAKLDADLKEKTDAVPNLKSAIAYGNGGKETFGNYGQFVNGNLANGVVYTNVKYRVTTNTIMVFDRDIDVIVANGFRFAFHVFVDGSFSVGSGWLTGHKVITAGTNFKIIIARETDDESEVADINTFLSKLTFQTVTQSEIEELAKDVADVEQGMETLADIVEEKIDFVEFVDDPNFEDQTNVVDETEWESGKFRGTDGNTSSSQYTTNYICSDFIPVRPGLKYRLYVNGICAVVAMYYSNAKNDGTQVSVGTLTTSSGADITIPDGKTFVAFNCSMNHSNRVSVMHRLTQLENEKNVYFPRLVYGTQEWIGKKIVNFGDSIFDNGQVTGEDISTYLAQKTGATVLNCAFGGCRMGAHTASQFDAFSMYKLADAVATGVWTAQDEALSGDNIPANFATTLARLKAIDFSKVDIITISYGTNDFAGGLGLGGDSKYFTDWALDYSIKTILTAFPNVRIFVCLPIYRVWLTEQYAFDEDSNTKEVTTWTGGDVKHKLTDFAEAERTVCKANQIPVIDNYFDIGMNKWNWSIYFPSTDGTHPNVTGRKLIAEHIASVIW